MLYEKYYILCGIFNYILLEIVIRSVYGFEFDVWFLGCMFYTLFIGRLFFDTDIVKNILNKVVLVDYKMLIFLLREVKDFIYYLFRRNLVDRLSLFLVLEYFFMFRNFLIKSKDLGIVEDLIDSGYVIIFIVVTVFFSISMSGSLFDRRRFLIG